jgi:hypothetical protein
MPTSFAPVPIHRSMRRLSPGLAQIVQAVLLLPIAFNVATWAVRRSLASGWAMFFAFWLDKLELAGRIELRSVGPAEAELLLPHLEIPTRSVCGSTWGWTLGAAIALLLVSRRLPDALLPLRYLLRLVAILQGTALAYFALPAATAPYSTPDYLDALLRSAAWLVFLVPWMHGVTYHLFEFSLARKVAFTLLTLVFLLVAAPFQVMLHAYVLATGSVLFMPLLYLLGGTWLLVFGCIALYGLAMSWPRKSGAAVAVGSPELWTLRRLPDEGRLAEVDGGESGDVGDLVAVDLARIVDGAAAGVVGRRK